ncbi:MAG: GIY-YIG nuclease family protein [Thaumarchaeota archaeon]|nr:GIY-YIG nuclease family protein [Nitrososphaerota archaeon]MCL5318398.1 GIY-YIG nuclease family protein [Nitrososphaerota archaeon]
MNHIHRNYPATKSVGVYTLVLQVKRHLSLSIGSLGRVNLVAGRYLYTGSALGPGGLDSRLARHLRKEKRVFWHIDYLTVDPCVDVSALVRSDCITRAECRVNKMLQSRLAAECTVPGFGSSDCGECLSHLLLAKDSEFGALTKKIMDVYSEVGLNPSRKVFSN